MSELLVASSPVEIQAKAGESGQDPRLCDTALALFHELTDRLGQAARRLEGAGTWPTHRFYFGPSAGEIAVVLQGLRARSDLLEVGPDTSSGPVEASGLFTSEKRDGWSGLLVGHESHEGLPSGR